MDRNVERVAFLGSKTFGLETLRFLVAHCPGVISTVVCCDDRKDGRSVQAEFVAFCRQANLELRITTSASETHEHLLRSEPDLAFVNGWYQMLSPETLDLMRSGVIGIHHSPLPAYRGAAPLVWQLINGEPRIGSSLFYLTPEMDAGNVIAQVWAQNHNLYIDEARKILEAKMLRVLDETWDGILSGQRPGEPQDHNAASFCAPIRPSDGLLDWTQPACKLVQRIRAQAPPYPCSFTNFKGEEIRITRASESHQSWHSEPGRLVSFDESSGAPIFAAGGSTSVILEGILGADGQDTDARTIFNRRGLSL